MDEVDVIVGHAVDDARVVVVVVLQGTEGERPLSLGLPAFAYTRNVTIVTSRYYGDARLREAASARCFLGDSAGTWNFLD